MVSLIVIDREFRLALQNSLCLEYYKKKVFLYSLKQFVRSASYIGEKYIVEFLPRESKRLFTFVKKKITAVEFSSRNVFYLIYGTTVLLLLI